MIRVNCGAQDVSLYTHSWRPSKAMLDQSQVFFSSSASYLASAFWLSHIDVVGCGGGVRLSRLHWMRKERLMGLLGLLASSHVNEFKLIQNYPY